MAMTPTIISKENFNEYINSIFMEFNKKAHDSFKLDLFYNAS